MKSPITEQAKPPEPPKEAPRRGAAQLVYIKLDQLHAFKNHPLGVRDALVEELRVQKVIAQCEESESHFKHCFSAGRLARQETHEQLKNKK